MFKIDKLYHLIVGVAIYLIATYLLGIANYISLLIVALIGWGKEFAYDAFNQDKHTPDYLDFFATVIGALIIYLIF